MPTSPSGQLTAPVLVDVDELVLDGSPRSQLDDNYARALARVRKPLPAVIVHAPTRRVIDGRHRVRAAILRGERQGFVTLLQRPDTYFIAIPENPKTMTNPNSEVQKVW